MRDYGYLSTESLRISKLSYSKDIAALDEDDEDGPVTFPRLLEQSGPWKILASAVL